jgi:hypothetical protein
MNEYCYLETHQERNLHFYEGVGSNAVFEGDVPAGGPHVRCLDRPPRSELELISGYAESLS